MRSACAHSMCASLVRGVFSLIIRGSSSCGIGAFSKFDSSMKTFLTIQTRLAGFLVCIQKIVALLKVWCMNAGTMQLSNTVYNCDAGVSPKNLVSQYAAVYTLLNVIVFETKPWSSVRPTTKGYTLEVWRWVEDIQRTLRCAIVNVFHFSCISLITATATTLDNVSQCPVAVSNRCVHLRRPTE